jgi:hypothetical protein
LFAVQLVCPGWRLRSISLGAAAVLALMLSGSTAVLAQDASPSPEVVASAAAEGADGPAFPSSLAGSDLEVLTYRGPEWLAEFQDGTEGAAGFAAETEALLASLGKDLEDLTVRSALTQPSEGNQAVILALQVDGAEARDFADDAVRLLLGDVNEPEFVIRPLGDRWVLRVVDAAVPGVYPRTVYLADDTMWIIGADEEYVLELLDQLPIQSFDVATDAVPLAEQLPAVLDGRRRTGLYEAREPLFLPTLSERLGPVFEDWLLDLYLADGITPTDLVGAIAWWGIESSEDSVEVEGYQVPGGSAEVVERLRTEVFLAEDLLQPDLALEPTEPQSVERVEQELGGRQVTTLDLGYATQHVFGSGDTIWVVTDHAGEPAMAEEAIAALP